MIAIEPDRPTQLFAVFLFRGGAHAPLDQLEAWVDAVPIKDRFHGYQDHPVPVGGRPAHDAYVAIQVPRALLGDTSFDLFGVIEAEVREAILHVLGHGGGDHSACPGLPGACHHARPDLPCSCEVPDGAV